MIRYFCDRCGDETTDNQYRVTVLLAIDYGSGAQPREMKRVSRHYCSTCADLVFTAGESAVLALALKGPEDG